MGCWRVGLTAEFEGELAIEAVAKCTMLRGATPDQAETFVGEWRMATLLERRAKLTPTDDIGLRHRLHELGSKLSPEIRQWIEKMPDGLKPRNEEEMLGAIGAG